MSTKTTGGGNDYTEKILVEFDEKFPLFKSEEAMVFASRRRIKAFISTSITQALAEDRERVVAHIKELTGEMRTSETDKILSFLDKPLTDKDI